MAGIANQIASELNIKSEQVAATIALLSEGATVPFIARYRKEQTGALDDNQLRKLEERLTYITELNERRTSILKSIEEQGKLSPELAKQIGAADNKQTLEDLYLPFKRKRTTKGQLAIAAGLEPLADKLFQQPELKPEDEAQAFINADAGYADEKAVLEGTKYILMERFSEDAELLAKLKTEMWQKGVVHSAVADKTLKDAEKFRDYFDYREDIVKLPSHRALALFRGRKEGVITINLIHADADLTNRLAPSPCERIIATHVGIAQKDRPADTWLNEVVRWTWRIKLNLHIETELFGRLRDSAEQNAIEVFAENLKDLLLAAPAGNKVTMGLDPGLRTGVKLAVVDATGKLLEYATIYPHAPKNQWDSSLDTIAKLAKKHSVSLLSIGNGTASRETEKLCADVGKRHPELNLSRIVVSEAGASVYSASELAALEFPDIDVTIRGAVSIARRLQDPLAELVKIEPKAIGVGQYQHDVSQVKLSRSLDAVIEDCVNAVGVDLNMASAPLLARVSGLSTSLASNIVSFRDANGAFSNRSELKKVARLGDKAFEQCAGFLRIRNGTNPLDASSVHPESYGIVQSISRRNEIAIEKIMGNSALLSSLAANDLIAEGFGEHTVKDVLMELAKPGRDPRPEFKFAAFKEGIEELRDLEEGMILEGAVTNVTNFGAFVDIGVHQDGLVHISALANRFVKDPREVVKTGDIVKVKVIEVDVKRKRIALSMRMDDSTNKQSSNTEKEPRATKASNKKTPKKAEPVAMMQGSMASAFAKAKAK
jgi:protein Tex